jgi:hypothetical protein
MNSFNSSILSHPLRSFLASPISWPAQLRSAQIRSAPLSSAQIRSAPLSSAQIIGYSAQLSSAHSVFRSAQLGPRAELS